MYERRPEIEPILNWGAEVVMWFQQASPFLDLPFKVFTFMGDADFFMILIPTIYWCVDRRNGARLAILFLGSVYLNEIIKVLAAQPRPFAYNPHVLKLVEATGNGFPSGHTQQAVVVWVYLAARLQKTWGWIIAAVLMLLIPVSRIYLGVHFPTDLLGGYLLGGLLVLLYLKLEPTVEKWLFQKGIGWQIMLSCLLPVFLVLIFPGHGKNAVSAMGALTGMGAGFAFERRWVCFESHGSGWQRFLRFMAGMAVVALIRYGVKFLFAGIDAPEILRFIRYALIGLWGGFGAPWIFCQLKLAQTKSA